MGRIRHLVCVSLAMLYYMDMADISSAQFSSYMNVKTIQRDINELITTETSMAVSLAQCSFRCAKVSSASLYFLRETQTCHCNNAKDTDTHEDSSKPDVVYAQPDDVKKVPPLKDCLEHYESGLMDDGVYPIQPEGMSPMEVWCDMNEGGWTVIQRRHDGSENFTRGWPDYVTGFGSRSGEYWLGLDAIHALTLEPSELNITMETFGDVTPTSAIVSYLNFKIAGQSENYRSDWTYSVEACSAMNGNGQSSSPEFSTIDIDNDKEEYRNCAAEMQGAWWYTWDCGFSNFNGPYLFGKHTDSECGVRYIPCWGQNYSLKKVVIKLRRFTFGL